MSKVTFEIVNEDLFHEKVIEVDTSGLKNKGTNIRGNSLGFYGDLAVETEDRRTITYSGYFGTNDYKTIYGFILTTT